MKTPTDFILDYWGCSWEDLEPWKEQINKLPLADFGNILDLMEKYAQEAVKELPIKKQYFVEYMIKKRDRIVCAAIDAEVGSNATETCTNIIHKISKQTGQETFNIVLESVKLLN